MNRFSFLALEVQFHTHFYPAPAEFRPAHGALAFGIWVAEGGRTFCDLANYEESVARSALLPGQPKHDKRRMAYQGVRFSVFLS